MMRGSVVVAVGLGILVVRVAEVVVWVRCWVMLVLFEEAFEEFLSV